MTKSAKICGDLKPMSNGHVWECQREPRHSPASTHYYTARPHETRESEASLEEYFREQIAEHGGFPIKMAPTKKGVPDRLVAFPVGRLFLVELKADDGTVSPIQKLWHERILRFGVTVHVIYGRTGIDYWIRTVETDSV